MKSTAKAASLPGLIEEGEAFKRLSRDFKPATESATAQNSRRFHGGLAVAFLVTAFIGFAPSYYLKALTDAPPVSPLRHGHGIVFTAWLVLLFAQSALVAAHRVRVHMRLGIFGVLLAATMVPLGMLTAVASARDALASSTPHGDPLFLLVFQLGSIVMFAAFVGTSLWNRRRNPEIHRRLMVLATVSILPAAISRWPIVDKNAVLALGLSLLFVVAGMINDWRSRGRVHPAYIWGALLIALSGPVRAAIGQSDAWHASARVLVEGLGS